MSDDAKDERIAVLVAERDKAREECGHQRAMRQSISDEFQTYIRRSLADRERLSRARLALVETGYFTEDQVTDDIAPRIVELVSSFRPVADTTTETPEEQR